MSHPHSSIVTVYGTGNCPFCVMAKRLLAGKGVQPAEINVGADQALLVEMMTRSGGAQCRRSSLVSATSAVTTICWRWNARASSTRCWLDVSALDTFRLHLVVYAGLDPSL